MADYTFTIKTPAELAGVEKAIASFEQLRGQAQANGKEFGELDQKIARAKASIEAYNQTVAASAPPAAAAADDSARYAKALEDMAAAAHEARAEEAQRQIDLRNTTSVSLAGAAATKAAIESLAGAQRKATTASDEHEASGRKVDKAFGALAAAGGPLARTANLFRELAVSPLTIGLALGSVAISSIMEKFRAWREEISATKMQLEQIEFSKFSSMVDGIKNAYLELNTFNRAIRDAGKPDDQTKILFDQRLEVISAELEKKKSLLKLNEELEVSNARLALGGDKDKEELQNMEKQIRARYASAQSGLETDADRKSMQELQNELAIRAGNAPGLKQTAEGLKRIAVGEKKSPITAEAAAQIELLGGKEGVVEKLRLKVQELQKAVDSWNWRDLFSGDDIPKRQQRADSAREELQRKAATLAQAQKTQTITQANQQDLDQSAGDALGKYAQNEAAITSLRQQLSKRQKVDPIKRDQRATESMFGLQGNPDSNEFLLAVAGAHNIRSGERATPDQARSINRVGQVEGFSGKNLDRLLKILDGLFSQQEHLAVALQRYEQKLSDTSYRLRDAALNQ